MAKLRVGIVGASGYTGVELLRLCSLHPDFDVVVATGDSQAGTAAAALYPSLAASYPELVFSRLEPDLLLGLDVVFLALPHGEAQLVAPNLLGRVGVIVDLSADFRLRDASLYPRWYGAAHSHPELLPRFAYGLPELFRQDIVGAEAVAAPGCYVTASALAIAPLVRAGVIDPQGVIVDAASGVSGAGRSLKANTAFCTVDEDFTAYGLLDHRHTPEIEQATGAQVLFTPHLAPMNRGILATCYARPAEATSTESLLATLARSYKDEPFVVVGQESPSTKATLGSNTAHLTARYDERTGWVVVLAAIDNLVKGASGQAIQCANIALGLPETAGPAARRDVPVSSGAAEKASILVEALPYIRRFSGRTVVVEYGGNALAGTGLAGIGLAGTGTDALTLFAQDIVLMRSVGMRPVVVHGGGPQISDLMRRLGKTAEFRDGLRVTDAETVDIARMVLLGQVNPSIVSAINRHGSLAIGVSGEDAGLIRARRADPELGFVGEVDAIDPVVLVRLLDQDMIPVVATIGTDDSGQAYNINADAVAGAIRAEALGAEKLVYLTDIEGVRRNVDDPSSLIRQSTADELQRLIDDGVLQGGMIPKIASCVHAVSHGVERAHILDGRIPHVLLLEIFTDEGIGTMVTKG